MLGYEETCKTYKNFVFISTMSLIDYLKHDLIRLMAISSFVTFIRNRRIISDPVFQQDCAGSLTFSGP